MEIFPQPPHIVVVGAGILGASIAYNLAQRNARVTVLDAAEPGRQTTAVSFAWLNSRDKNPRHYHDLNRRSVDVWSRFVRRLDVPDAVTWGGELRWAVTPTGAEALLDRVETLQSWGYPIRSLSEIELKRMEPGLCAGKVLAASYSEIDGHVDAVRVVRTCIERITDDGNAVHAHTPVTGFQVAHVDGERRITAVHTDEADLPCDAVVLAVGPDTPAVAQLTGVDVPLYHTFGANLLTDPIPPVLQTVAVIHCPRDTEPRVHVRQLPDGRFVIQGGTHGQVRDESLGRNEEEVARMVEAARRYLPALAGVPIVDVCRGRRPIPEDGLPIIGYTQAVPNLYLAAMHSGVTLAALVGELATIEILDDVQVDLLEPYRLERFERV